MGPAELIGNNGSQLVGNNGSQLVGINGSQCQAQAYSPAKAVNALVYLIAPDETFYRDEKGQVVRTTTDAEGRYSLPAAVGKDLVVTAVLGGDRRLVGYTVLSNEGAGGQGSGQAPLPDQQKAVLDVTLKSTYVTEFLRYQAWRQGKTLGAYPLAKVQSLIGLTRKMLDAGDLEGKPDLTIASIPDLVNRYLIAFPSRNRALSDAWTDLLGYRPLAVSTLDDSAGAGFSATALAHNPATGAEYMASYDEAGVEVREAGGRLLWRRTTVQGFHFILGMDVDPQGRYEAIANVDRGEAGAVDWTRDPPAINLYRQASGSLEPEVIKLQLPAELKTYLDDAGLSTWVEPAALAWHADKLYVADSAAGLIDAFSPTATGSWPGSVCAGSVVAGRPIRGYRDADSAGAARFENIKGLAADPGGNLFITMPATPLLRNQVLMICNDPTSRFGLANPEKGRIYRILGTDAASAGLGGFDRPLGLATDDQGNLFVADRLNHRIVRIAAADAKLIRVAETGLLEALAPPIDDDDVSTLDSPLVAPSALAWRRTTAGEELFNRVFDPKDHAITDRILKANPWFDNQIGHALVNEMRIEWNTKSREEFANKWGELLAPALELYMNKFATSKKSADRAYALKHWRRFISPPTQADGALPKGVAVADVSKYFNGLNGYYNSGDDAMAKLHSALKDQLEVPVAMITHDDKTGHMITLMGISSDGKYIAFDPTNPDQGTYTIAPEVVSKRAYAMFMPQKMASGLEQVGKTDTLPVGGGRPTAWGEAGLGVASPVAALKSRRSAGGTFG